MAMSSEGEGANSLTPVLVITTNKATSDLDIASDFLSLVAFAESQNQQKCLPKPRPALFYELATEDNTGFKMPPYVAKLCSVKMKDLSGRPVSKDNGRCEAMHDNANAFSKDIRKSTTNSSTILSLPPYATYEEEEVTPDLENSKDLLLANWSPHPQHRIHSSRQFLSPPQTSSQTNDLRPTEVVKDIGKANDADLSRINTDTISMFSEQDETPRELMGDSEKVESRSCLDFQLPTNFEAEPQSFFVDALQGNVWNQPVMQQPFYPNNSPFTPSLSQFMQTPSPFAFRQSPFMNRASSFLTEPDPFLRPNLFSYVCDPFTTPMYWSAPFDGCSAGGDKTSARITDVEVNNCEICTRKTDANADLNPLDCSPDASYDTCLSHLDVCEPRLTSTTNREPALKWDIATPGSTSSNSQYHMPRQSSLSAKPYSTETRPKDRINKFNTSSAPESKVPKKCGSASRSNKSVLGNSWSRTLRSISEDIAYQKLRQHSLESNSRKHAHAYTNKSYIMKAILSLFKEPKASHTLSVALSSESSCLGNSTSSVMNYLFREKLKGILSDILIERAELQLHCKPRSVMASPLQFCQRQNTSYSPPLSPVEEQEVSENQSDELYYDSRNSMSSSNERSTCCGNDNCKDDMATSESDVPIWTTNYEPEYSESDIPIWTTEYEPNPWLEERWVKMSQHLQQSESLSDLAYHCLQREPQDNINSSCGCSNCSSRSTAKSRTSSPIGKIPVSVHRISRQAPYCGLENDVGNAQFGYTEETDGESIVSFCNCDLNSANFVDLPLHCCSCSNLNLSNYFEIIPEELVSDQSNLSNERLCYEPAFKGNVSFGANQNISTSQLTCQCGNVYSNHNMQFPWLNAANSRTIARTIPQQFQHEFVDDDSNWEHIDFYGGDLYDQAPTFFVEENDNMPRSCCSGSDIRLGQWEPNARDAASVSAYNISYVVRPEIREPSGDFLNTKTCSCTNTSLNSSSESWRSHY